MKYPCQITSNEVKLCIPGRGGGGRGQGAGGRSPEIREQKGYETEGQEKNVGLGLP